MPSIGRKIGLSISFFLIMILYLYVHYSLSVWVGWGLSIVGIAISYLLGRKIDQIIGQSNQDRLTRLYNRKFIEESFPKLKSLALRNNSKLFVLVIDCNNFKSINDHYGHIKGDLVLQSISQLLLRQFRNSDLASRWGGDEFVVIGQLTHTDAIPSIIARIHTDIRYLSENLNIPVSISIGCSVFPDDHAELHDLFEMADLQMYEQKSS